MTAPKIIHGDCLAILQTLPSQSVDLVLTDLPYGITQNKWDKALDLKQLWPALYRVAKLQAPFIFTAAQPFVSHLVLSNHKAFRHDWIWRKNKSTGFLNAKKAPLRAHEHIVVFCRRPPLYFPQKTEGHPPVHNYTKHTPDGTNYGKTKLGITGGGSTSRYPTSVLTFPVVNNDNKLHPTQKPEALFAYLIRTYSKRNAMVLDPCAGSGTTGAAALACARRSILIDKDPKMIDLMLKRLL